MMGLLIICLLFFGCDYDTREISAECLSGCDDFQVRVKVGDESFTVDVYNNEVNIW